MITFLLATLTLPLHAAMPDTSLPDTWRQEARQLASQPYFFREGKGAWFAAFPRGADTARTALRLSIPLGEGLIERTVAVGPGLQVQPPGLGLLDRLHESYAAGTYPEAIRESFDLLWNAWEPNFWLIPEEYLARLLPLPEMALASGEWFKAQRQIQILLDLIHDPSARDRLLDLRLLVLELSGDRTEALREAVTWMESRSRYGPSALGYRIAAALALESGDFETALWTALEPITFSGPLPMSDLAICYRIALAASLAMGEESHALLLFQEMRDRGLPWPKHQGDPEDTLLSQLDALARPAGEIRTEPSPEPGSLNHLLRGLRPRVQHEHQE